MSLRLKFLELFKEVIYSNKERHRRIQISIQNNSAPKREKRLKLKAKEQLVYIKRLEKIYSRLSNWHNRKYQNKTVHSKTLSEAA